MKTPQAAAFHFGLLGAWSAIGLLYIITPFCWCYVLWTLITLAPALAAGRPAQHGALRVLHYIFLTYCAIEIPFSIYYNYLAWRAQRSVPTPQYTKDYLRNVIYRALENGMKDHSLPALMRRRSGVSERTHSREEKAAQKVAQEDEVRHLQQLGKFDHHEASELDLGASLTSSPSYETNLASPLSASGTSSAPWSPRPPPTRSSLESLRAEEAEAGPSTGEAAAVPPAGAAKDKSAESSIPGALLTFLKENLSPSDPRAIEFKNYIKMWWHDVPFSALKRENVRDWFAWSLWSADVHELEKERAEKRKKREGASGASEGSESDEKEKEKQESDSEAKGKAEEDEKEGDRLSLVDHCVDLVEKRAGQPIPAGKNPHAKAIRLTLDPVKVRSRPFLLYAFVGAFSKLVARRMMLAGFKEVKEKDLRYLVRIPEGWTPDRNGPERKRPLIFVHGLGMGLAQYATLMMHLATDKELKDRPIAVLIQPHISMAFFSKNYLRPPTMTTLQKSFGRLAKRHKFDQSGVTFLSHSNGTIVHGWICKAFPDLVVRSCFVDPVCFCLWEPFVCFNFLYSKPTTPITYLMRYFVGRELAIALTLQRYFDWSTCLLFPDSIPSHTSPYHASYFLAGSDAILNADRVAKYLKSCGVAEVTTADEASGKVVGQDGGMRISAGQKHGEAMIGNGDSFDAVMRFVTMEPPEPPQVKEKGKEVMKEERVDPDADITAQVA